MLPSARSKQETANDALKTLLQKTADPCEGLHTKLMEEAELHYRESQVQFRRTTPHPMTPKSDEEISWMQKPTSGCLIHK